MFRITNKLNFGAVVIFLAVSILSLIWFSFHQQVSPNLVKVVITPKVTQPSPSPILIPSPSPIPKTSTKSQISPDGKIELIITSDEISAKRNNYLFYTKAKDAAKKLVFSQILDNSTEIQIPFNTWSPDNKYFYVNQQTNNSNHFLVFKSSGEKFKDEDYLDITNFYLQKEIAYQLFDVTGWAAPGLLIVTTKKADDTQGQSFWFDLSNHSFIPLSTRF